MGGFVGVVGSSVLVFGGGCCCCLVGRERSWRKVERKKVGLGVLAGRLVSGGER